MRLINFAAFPKAIRIFYLKGYSMTPDIAVICASPPGINPGMDSVDLAFMRLAKKYNFFDRVTFYRLYPAIERGNISEKDEPVYSIIPSDPDFFQSQKAIIYWGDFLHMRQYHEAVARKMLNDGIHATMEDAQRRVQEILLLSNQNTDVMGNALTFGSTLLFNTMRDELHPTYGPVLERFLRNCRAAWFRDIYSALKVCHIRGTYHPNCLGVDCANLLDPDAISARSPGYKPENTVGIFLGRTTGNAKSLIRFALNFARKAGFKPAWLPWGDKNSFPGLMESAKSRDIRALDHFADQPFHSSTDALRNLLNYHLIITDTYHVCVNAWNLGIPAICLTGNETLKTRNVNSGNSYARKDKRQVFLGMYDALDFLVTGAELDNKAQGEARTLHLVDLIHSGKEVEAVYNRIRSHSKFAEDSLIHQLSGII